MAENRTEKIAAMLPPSLYQDLTAYADVRGWTVSTAAYNLIRQALDAERRSHGDAWDRFEATVEAVRRQADSPQN